MKKNIIIIGVVLLVFSIALIFQSFRINNLKDANQLQAVELSSLNDEVDVFQARNGELSFKLASVTIEKGNLKKSLDLAGFDIKELKEQDIKWRKLTNALQIKLQASGSVSTTVIDTFYTDGTPEKPDTVYYSTFNEWSNDYLSIYNGKIIEKELTFDYNYKVGIELFQEARKNKIIVTAKLTDPNAQIISANSLTIEHKNKFWEKWWFWGAAGITTGILISK